jgi:hypothetical protein
MKSEAQECKTPVVFIVFNRPEHTETVFRRIAQVRPSRLLIIADGPRADKLGEVETCERVRHIATQVDWTCEVLTNFSDSNMGCRRRVISGLNWAFEQVEEAIILEDDVLPDLSFFRFCEEMLARFRYDSRISMVTGFNIIKEHPHTQWSYYCSQLTHIWGWATWRRSWASYDEHLSEWPSIKAAGLMQELFALPEQRRFWTHIFDEMYNGTGPDTWDYQWGYTNLVNRRLSVAPRINLIENIGFGPEATHTHRAEDAPLLVAGTLSFPLIHPPAMIPLRKIDELDGRLCKAYIPGLAERALRKLERAFAKAAAGRGGART